MLAGCANVMLYIVYNCHSQVYIKETTRSYTMITFGMLNKVYIKQKLATLLKLMNVGVIGMNNETKIGVVCVPED